MLKKAYQPKGNIIKKIFFGIFRTNFLKLKNNNLVKSSRGANGGYILDKPATEIKLSNIIFAVDEK